MGGSWLYGGGLFVASYTISGNTAPALRWLKISSTGGCQGIGVALDSLGHVLATGSFNGGYGAIDFGGISSPTTPFGSTSGFVSQYSN